MMSRAGNRRELEAVWRERVRQARIRFDDASKAFRAICDEHTEEKLSSDPTYAIQQARKAESEALEAYVSVLKIFCDLVLHGKIPEEGADKPT